MASCLTSPGTTIVSGVKRGEFHSNTNPRNRASFKGFGGSEKGGIFRVCSSVMDREIIGVLDDREVGFLDERSWGFSAPVKQSSAWKQSKEDQEKQNYYINAGYAIRALREEFPQIFHKELSYDIYRDDIVFKDPLNTFVGIENYKSIFWALRFHGNLFFKALRLDIVSVWQPVESTIMIRWTIHGIPRIPWEGQGRFDGTSEYKLDKNGKIYEHKVDNVLLNSPPKFSVQAVDQMIQFLGCPSTPKPTFFEISSFIMEYMPFI